MNLNKQIDRTLNPSQSLIRGQSVRLYLIGQDYLLNKERTNLLKVNKFMKIMMISQRRNYRGTRTANTKDTQISSLSMDWLRIAQRPKSFTALYAEKSFS